MLQANEERNENGENLQAQAWREFFEAIDAIEGEELPEKFERVNLRREVDI